jgi:hypothetical protein
MLVNDKVYRVKLYIDQSNYIIPNFFEEQGQLKGKTITGLSVDIAQDRASLQWNFASNDPTAVTGFGVPNVNNAQSLSYMYLTLYNTNDEIIIDQAPLNLFSNWNANYPQPGPLNPARNGKKQVIPMNTHINIRQSFVKGTPGFTLFNSIISFNFYYK